jgi:hypothetical protein
VTEPISDEKLAELRHRRPAAGKGADYVDALLARLDAAEARAHRLDNELTRQAEILSSVKVERDAALARAVPDGWKVKWNIHGVPLLVPADTEPGEPT